MSRRAIPFEQVLDRWLAEPADAAAYLTACLQDEAPGAEQVFLLALRDVARAHGVGRVAQRAGLGRESLYKALSGDGNPKLATLRAVLGATGLRLSVEAAPSRGATRRGEAVRAAAAQQPGARPRAGGAARRRGGGRG